MAIKWHEDPSGYLVYTNTKTGQQIRIWGDTLSEIAFACQEWHGGKRSACYRMLSGDYSFKTLDAARTELYRALDAADDGEGDDAYFDLAETVDDLEGVVGRIARIL